MAVKKSNEQIILDRLKTLPVTPLKFKPHLFTNLTTFNSTWNGLKQAKSVPQRILWILSMNEICETYYMNGQYQCRTFAHRSAQDIYRLYKYYFKDDKSIFDIMRALYYLSVVKKKLNNQYCTTVQKLVFYKRGFSDYIEKYHPNDLGVPFRNWKNIGKEKK